MSRSYRRRGERRDYDRVLRDVGVKLLATDQASSKLLK